MTPPTLRIKGIKGDDGKTPSSEEIVELIKPLIPEPIKGEDGKDGETPTEEKIVELIKPLIPKPIKGEKGEDGIDGISPVLDYDKIAKKLPKEDITPKIISEIKKLNKDEKSKVKLDIKDLKGGKEIIREVQNFYGTSGQEYRIDGVKKAGNASVLNLKAGTNITLSGSPTSDGADITINAIGDGTGTVTSTSVVTANGFSGTVTNPTTTPAITIDASALDATKIADGSVTNTEFQYINSLTSNAQTQLDGKQASGTYVTGATNSTLTLTSTTLGLNLSNANTWLADQSVPDEAYGAGWNGSLEVPTKNALYDKIETLGSGASIGGAMTGGTAGSIIFVSPDAIIAQNNQNLFWDNTLKNLLISSTLGSELLTNGTFTGNATGWTVPSGFAYSSNTVVHSSNGTGALQPSTALTTVITGFEYQYSIDVSALTVGTATLACGGVTLVAITANGTYTGKFVATSNANLTITPTSTSRFTVDNVSLKRLSGGSVYAGSHVGDTHTAVKSALGATTSAGFIAENTTPATSGVQQASPSILRKGQGYLSNTGASFPFEVQDYVIGKVNITPYGQWINQWRGNSGSWTEFLSFDADPVGLGFNFTGPATSGSNPGSARFATFNNTGANTWFDFKFSGTRRASFGVNSSGEITFNSTGNFLHFTDSSNNILAQIYSGGIYNNGGSFNAGRVTAGTANVTPPTTFSNYGSTSLKTTVITTNTTLTDDYTQVIVDCSSNNSCTGTPSTTACSTYTASGQGTCESHLPCVWDAGTSCSVYDNEFGMGTCAGTSGCSVSTSACTGGDEATCLANDDAYGGSCSWSAGSDCSAFNGNEAACSGQSGCSINTSNSCPSQFDEGSCTGAGCSWDGMTCTGDNSTCTGTYGAGCSGTYNTGSCTGTFGAACTGTATCGGYGTQTPCETEAGCAWTSGVEITLPATPEEQTYWIAKDYTSGALTILPNSGQTVNNTTSITSSSTAGVGWMLTWVQSKSNWYIMNSH